MQKPKYTLLAAGAYLALVGTFVVTTSRSGISQGNGQPAGKDVRVINTAAEAVPVSPQGTTTITGNVNVANSPTVKIDAAASDVKAAQSGTWTVGIAGTPTVKLADGATVQAIAPAPKPFRIRLNYPLDGVSNYTNSTADLLVVDLVSSTTSSSGLEVNTGTSADPYQMSYRMMGTPNDVGGLGAREIHELTKLYVKPGEVLSVRPVGTIVYMSGHWEPYAP